MKQPATRPNRQRLFCLTLFSILITLSNSPVAHAENTMAHSAADSFNRDFDATNDSDIWDNLVSKYMSNKVTKQAFVAQLSIFHSQFGGSPSSRDVIQNGEGVDPASGLANYFIRFKATYPVMSVYEDLTFIQEDGGWKLAGFYFYPAKN